MCDITYILFTSFTYAFQRRQLTHQVGSKGSESQQVAVDGAGVMLLCQHWGCKSTDGVSWALGMCFQSRPAGLLPSTRQLLQGPTRGCVSTHTAHPPLPVTCLLAWQGWWLTCQMGLPLAPQESESVPGEFNGKHAARYAQSLHHYRLLIPLRSNHQEPSQAAVSSNSRSCQPQCGHLQAVSSLS